MLESGSVEFSYPGYFRLIADCIFLLSRYLFIFDRKNEPKTPEENTKRSKDCTSFIFTSDFEMTPVGLVSPQTPMNAQETILFSSWNETIVIPLRSEAFLNFRWSLVRP